VGRTRAQGPGSQAPVGEGIMGDEIKENLKRAVQQAEVSVTKSILRWKYKKEGRTPPREERLEEDSRRAADRAHEVVARRGKTVWEELKKSYFKGRDE